MANRRNSKKSTTTATEKVNYPNPRMVLWVADEDRKYSSSGTIQFTREQVEQMSQLFEDYAEEDKFSDERLTIRFFLYENENGSEKAPDEVGSLSFTLLTDD